MRLLKILLVIVFSGCASLPPKPEGDLCTLDIPNQIGRCAPISDGNKVSDLELSRLTFLISQSPNAVHIPLSEMDKYVAFSPQTWSNIVVYIQKLKDLAQKGEE